MYIDGDTHYWPLRFLDKVKHPGKGYLEVVEDKGDMVRYGEVVPGKVATYYRDGKKVHSFKEGRWSLSLRAEFMKKDGFDVQVLIPDNRPLIYECDAELGRQLARAYNDTVAEDIQGDDRFIGCAWIYLPDIKESVKELRRAVKELGIESGKIQRRLGRRRSRQRSAVSALRRDRRSEYSHLAASGRASLRSCSTAIPGSSAANAFKATSIFPPRSAFR